MRLNFKILFISHDAYRTGAPILLLNLVKAINENYEVEFLLKTGGPLKDDFCKLAKCKVAVHPQKRSLFTRLLNKITKRNAKKLKFNIGSLDWKSYDLIISNTITNGDILPEVRRHYKGKIVSYIHELEIATNFFTNKENLKQLISCSDAYFVPSQVVKHHLITNLGIPVTKVQYLPYYIPPYQYIVSKPNDKDDFIVGSMGTSDWRKSPDLFIIIAAILFNKRPEVKIKFLWKGASSGKSIETDRLNYDIKKSGLEGKITFMEASPDVNDFYSAIDLFLLTSREDPYPLVVLEAANAEIPTICFDKAGGAPEFVSNSEGGTVIPYLDVNAAAEAILHYYDNRIRLKRTGENAKEKLHSTHQNIDYINEQFEAALKNI